ncbi:transcription termination factor Rho [bacterium (Candidatus Blackallbacteria) CG17_big_fil_post_rev_8_21_14_2_50_48_46]|uniref:Transcription termination factor Rho n=1 Tax=bacterium (Candidatus Blackallbacteria) CG17_big_fil_post_rev_8_21_14_2_50_48_46 TaxID=2014261 RepID=A0A2M7G554_9BACT|nr:MAG: transcription termination factor Rho [bacterium (Candidatus Blackallbacteria) CG18_big_fil_WC_8_21_14_2_50_49_26]PIW17054.1 MAG: transcription termination factor Rho [bacterium (Candidatus Blackallbacteria) CG17_big_fil_post_rev_8_21_14_2_50_48_46]PIW47711.1 MAG: transcription termination factor Rho [bacterium (Candidatus Blackallbacteria) CG13_big_fil_rev_8_21_14_2_50_49_14]
MRRNNNNNRPFKKRHPQQHHHPHHTARPQESYPEPDLSILMDKTLKDLYDIARGLSIHNPLKLRKSDLALRIAQAQEARANTRKGILEIMPEGYGFLRVNGYFPSSDDVYISQAQIKRFRLQTGHNLVGQIRPAKEGEKYASLVKIDSVNDLEPEKIQHLRPFDSLIPVYPEGQIMLETPRHDLSMRLMDIFSPIGRGQRGLIVSPPKAGKTTLLKGIAHAIEANHPDIVLIALLIDERPEEVTDFERSIKGEVVASTFDRLPEHHTRITELVLEKAKRLVEAGRDVVILLDSITRMSRAYNLIIPPSGRTLSGGLDPNAMHSPKRFFGAARKVEFGGSLTILATALVDTGSRMDEVIFEEFKGTGNMELRLDRKLAERRLFPAIDIKLSGTRKEEILLGSDVLRKEHLLRRMLSNADTVEATEFILERFKKSKTNDEFLQTIVDDSLNPL